MGPKPTIPRDPKIVLAQLNDALIYKGYKRNKTKRTPLGLAYLAGTLVAAGIEPVIVDAALNEYSLEQTVQAILSHSPDLVGITCTTPLFPQAAEITSRLKIAEPAMYIVLGGPHVSSLPELSLLKSPADCVCVGEGETVLLELIKALQNGKKPDGVNSIVYRWGQEILSTPLMRTKISHPTNWPAPPDLDQLPFPARQLLRVDEYVDYARGILTPQTSIITSRGCVGKCGFCNAGESFVRFRSPEKVIEELEVIYHRYHIRNLFFYDDSFTTNKKRVIQICRMMMERNLKFDYQVQLRLDQVDDEVMEWLVQSGCNQVGPGIESGNLEMLKSISHIPKGTPEFMLEKCRIIQKYPVKLRCSYIMGWIDETEEQVWDTIHLAQEINADESAFSIATPFPGTRMWQAALDRGLVSYDMDFSSLVYYHNVGTNVSRMPSSRLLELHELAYQLVTNRSYQLKEDSRQENASAVS